MIKLVAFDLDGTIGDTLPLCMQAFKQAVQPYVAHVLSDREVIRTFGLDEEGMIGQMVGNECRKQALYDFYSVYGQLHQTFCPNPFTGIRELISGLKQKGITVALVTGKGERSCTITLRRFDMETTFDKVLTGNSERNVKSEALENLLRSYRLLPSEMIYIGDTVSDITACRKAGVKCLSAAWSTSLSCATELERQNPGHVFRSVASVSEYLKQTDMEQST